jgi:poly-gamma-glutamate synthesis protein (capsule biosynthesis protein)
MAPSRRAVLRGAAGAATAAAGCLGAAPRASHDCPATVDGDEGAGGPDLRVGFAGDVMLGRGVDERWREGPPAGVWGSMHDRLRSLDAFVCNLECVVSDRGRPRPGRTYHFRADPGWAVPALRAGGVTVASLANNHVLDFGTAALRDTLAALDDAGVAHAGAGTTVRAAFRPAVVEAGPVTVGVVAFTDRSPTYAARPGVPGTAFVRPDLTDPHTRWTAGEALDRVHRADPDLVVASLHWGPNWEAEPSRARRAFARWLIDRGVDVVHGHSAHVIQGVELYRGRPILYDGGDFVDDYAVKPDLHNDRSLLFEVGVEGGRLDALRVHPVEIRREAAHAATGEVAAWVRDRVRSLSAPFGTTFEREGAGLRVPLSRCGASRAGTDPA